MKFNLNMNTRILLFLLMSFALFSCKNKEETTETKKEETQQTPVATAAPVEALPLPPLEKLEYLFENCTHIDYVFYDLPFSMSMDDQGSIQRTLAHISTSVAPEKADCKPMGRIFFDVETSTELEAEFFFSPGCVYFIFYEDGKKKYSSFMTPDAVKYMNNYLAQANSQRQQLMQK